MMVNFNNDNIKLDKSNYSNINPINKNDVKKKKLNGEYVSETFYLINFFNIKDNSYVISSFGRIFSLESNKQLNPDKSRKRKYQVIDLYTNDGSRKKFPISRLVAVPFVIRNKTDKEIGRNIVHYKNWDCNYNYYWNLEWRTQREIIIMTNLQSRNIEQVNVIKYICLLLEDGFSSDDIYGIIDERISKGNITKIKNRKIYTSISYKYNF